MMEITDVVLSRRVQSELKKLPKHVVTKLLAWVKAVEDEGLRKVRQISGFHDEPLKGDRAGQRSIRLSKSYRAIYRISEDGDIEIVEVLEVTKHRY